MKKSLSLLVAIAMVFSMFATVVSAAEEPTAGEYLNELGVILGNQDGDLKEDQTWKRQDIVVLLSRLFGAEDDAKGAEKTHEFKDVTDKNYDGYISWAVEEGLVKGKSATVFGFGDELENRDFYLLVLRALGQEVDYDKVGEAAVEAGLAPEDTDFDDIPLRGETYTAIVAALKTVVGENGETLEELLGLVEVVDLRIGSFEATGAKSLTVKFNKAVSQELAFAVKRDGTNVNVAKVDWNEAKTEAKLTTSSNLQTGKHVVTVTGADELSLTAEAAATAAKVSKIEFPSASGIIVDSTSIALGDKQGLRVNTKFYNQYNEDVTSTIAASDLSITVSKGAVESFDKGALKLVDGTTVNAAYDYIVDQKVVVTIVHKPSTTVGNATLTVVQSANVASIEIGDITTSNEDLQGKAINVANLDNNVGDYYIPVVAKDQYGNTLAAADLAALTILTSNNKILNVASTVTEVDGKTVLAIDAAVADATSGVVVVTLVAPNGTNANKTFEVIANAKIDSLNLSQPEDQLKKNVKTKIPFAAVDQFGEALVSNSQIALTSGNGTNKLTFADGTTVSATGGVLHYDVDYANKNAVKLSVTPSEATVVLNVITSTYKVQNLTLTAAAAPVATAIKGLKSSVYTLIQQGQTVDLKSSVIDVIDQYGAAIDLPNGFEIAVAATDGTADKVTFTAGELDNSDNAITLTAPSAVKGTESIKFTLFNADGDNIDEFTTAFETVELSGITTFQLADIGKVYTGGTITGDTGAFTLADYDRSITLEGLKGSKKVKVNQGLIATAGVTGGLEVVSNKIVAPTTKVDTSGADKEATLTVVVDTANGALSLSKTVAYNSATPAAATVVVRHAGSDYAAPTFVTTTALNGKNIGPKGNNAEVFFRVKDQYGVDFNLNQSYAITGKATALGAVSVTPEGLVSIATPEVGKSFQVTIVTQNGLTKTLQIILGA